MKPFRRFDGLVAPLLRANVDTDAIIPSREMKRVSPSHPVTASAGASPQAWIGPSPQASAASRTASE